MKKLAEPFKHGILPKVAVLAIPIFFQLSRLVFDFDLFKNLSIDKSLNTRGTVLSKGNNFTCDIQEKDNIRSADRKKNFIIKFL